MPEAPASAPTLGAELLLVLDRSAGRLRAQLERALRDAVRCGRLPAGARLPPSRTLAADLGVSRRLVVEAYEQLVAEGWFESRTGAGTTVVARPDVVAQPRRATERRGPRYDFFPGVPDLAAFPRAEYGRAMRAVLRELPDRELAYPHDSGAPALREELSVYLARVRGVATDPDAIVITGGASAGLGQLATVLRDQGARSIGFELPGLPPHRALVRAAGLEPVDLPVDADGADPAALARTDAAAAVITPAHQFPTGVAMAPHRRAAFLDWARGGRLLVEDDYDAEFRYDRAPVGALQAQAPDRVAHLGTVSKTLAPALRLGWLVLAPDLARAVAARRRITRDVPPVLDQHVLARLIADGSYDRHLRVMRRRYAARRAALAEALADHLPEARLAGLAAGLHALVTLPHTVDTDALLVAARAADVGAYPLPVFTPALAGPADTLVLGYAGMPEPALREGVRRLAVVVRELLG